MNSLVTNSIQLNLKYFLSLKLTEENSKDTLLLTSFCSIFIVETVSSKKLKTITERNFYKGCLRFETFEIGKYKSIQLPSFYKNLINSCRKSYLKGVVFLKSPISCSKLLKVLIKSFKNISLKLSKIQVQQQKWFLLLDLNFTNFTCIYWGFQCLIHFILFIENHIKCW